MAEPKPIFALDLSNDRIALWHRTGNAGWTVFGEVTLSDPNLPEEMKTLQGRAVSMHGNALHTVVRIPRSEVMMSRLKLGVFEGDAAESHARKLITDLTPYAFNEVSYDLGPKGVGNMAPVAVVAKKTLKEAEEFAHTHGFQPVYYTTQYGSREFPGEPRFYINPPKPSKMPLISRIAAAAAIGLTIGYFGYSTFLAPADAPPEVTEIQPEQSEAVLAAVDPLPKEQTAQIEEPEAEIAPSDQPPNDPATLLAALAAPSTTPYPDLVIEDAQPRSAANLKRLARVVPDKNISLPGYHGASSANKTDKLELVEAHRDLPEVELSDEVVEVIQSAMSISGLPATQQEAPIILAALTAPDISKTEASLSQLPKPQAGHGTPPLDAMLPADPPEPPPSLVDAEPGTLTPTPEGTLGPENILIFSGRPQQLPPARPDLSPPPDPLAEFRARPRPEGLVPEAVLAELAEEPPPETTDEPVEAVEEVTEPTQEEEAAEPSLLALADPSLAGQKAKIRPDTLIIFDVPKIDGLLALADPALGGFRSKKRPASLKVPVQVSEEVTEPQEPSENTLDSATKLAVAKSLVPKTRPARLATIAPSIKEEPSTATAITPDAAKGTARPAPGPTATTVAKAATEKGRFNKKKMSLVGVFGTPNARRALVRMPSGRYLKVKKGDKLSGWKVSAIGESSVRIRKGSKDKVLRMP
ncbi:MAG: type IV pilus biogenesis protein PilP [Rhodobacteraceae bacterium]|nr:type IV pilus biogenesis protein PilP [Paracoccaceae bacterium]